MRYGIMAMQMQALLPQDAPPEQLLAQVGSFSHAGLVRQLAGQGFSLIELGGDLGLFLPHTYAPPAIQELAALKAELGLTYTLHLPLWSVETSTPLAPVRRGSVQALVNTIQATQSLEPEVYVLHATGSLAAEFTRMRMPELARGLLLRQFQAAAQASIRTLLQETSLPSRRLAIETIEFPLPLTLELAEALDLSICFDTGHVLAGFSLATDFFDALERCLPRLAEIHLHDSPWRRPDEPPAYGLDHQPLGRGDLNLPRLLQRLDQAGFNGPIIFELSVAEALASLDTLYKLSPRHG